MHVAGDDQWENDDDQWEEGYHDRWAVGRAVAAIAITARVVRILQRVGWVENRKGYSRYRNDKTEMAIL